MCRRPGGCGSSVRGWWVCGDAACLPDRRRDLCKKLLLPGSVPARWRCSRGHHAACLAAMLRRMTGNECRGNADGLLAVLGS